MCAKKFLTGFFTVIIILAFSISAFADNKKISDRDFLMMCQTESAKKIIDALQRGANANAADFDGSTVLMRAAVRNDNDALKIMSALINAGANVNAREQDGWTALMRAAALNKNPEAVKLLIKAGADIYARDKNGRTALMWAKGSNKNSQVAEALIQAGADLSARNNYGMNVWDYNGNARPSYSDYDSPIKIRASGRNSAHRQRMLRRNYAYYSRDRRYRNVTYSEIKRNPGWYEGERIAFSGKVVQVMENGHDMVLRINQDRANEPSSMDAWLVVYHRHSGEPRIREYDHILIYGTCGGNSTYDAIAEMQGNFSENDTPIMTIDYYELID